MRVRIYKEVEVDAEVDVDFDDVLNELSTKMAEAEDETEQDPGSRWGRRLFLSVLDYSTRLIDRLPDEFLDQLTTEQRALVRHRLQRLADVCQTAETI